MQLWEIVNTNDTDQILEAKNVWAEDPPVSKFTINCTMVGSMKRLDDIETEKFSLEVYECNCGFHIGFDVTYLDQVDSIKINCPSCGEEIDTEKIPF